MNFIIHNHSDVHTYHHLSEPISKTIEPFRSEYCYSFEDLSEPISKTMEPFRSEYYYSFEVAVRDLIKSRTASDMQQRQHISMAHTCTGTNNALTGK
jgi:hypothetical protein